MDNEKHIISLMREVRTCIGNFDIDHLRLEALEDPNFDREKFFEKNINRGLRLSSELIERTANYFGEVHDRGLGFKWIPLEDELPPAEREILLSLKCGQVFHGFFQPYDVTKIIKQPDGKMSYAKFDDGGRWYRYRFCDYLPFKSVNAWAPLPVCYKEEAY